MDINLNDKINKKQTKARKQIKDMETKYKNGYLIKLWLFRGVITVIISIVIFNIINNIKWISDINTADISSINASTYSTEILEQYNKNGEKEKFEEYITKLEKSIAIYILNNTTIESDSFKKLVKRADKVINSNDWNELNIEKDTYYNGKYYLDENGKLKFKFEIKEIEPIWAKDSKYVTLH